MKFYEMIFSPTGGTKRVADILAKGWQKEFVPVDLTDCGKDYSGYTFAEDDVCLVAVPSYGGRVPEPAVLRLKELKGNGARAILVVVYGNRAYEDTMLELYDVVTEAGFVPAAGVAAIAEHSIMRQFASGRPDAGDEQVLTGYAGILREKVEEGKILQRADVPGKEPYREFGGVMKPVGNKSCTGCGICVKSCPVGAIPKDMPRKTDAEKCISCMRCVAVCPGKARKVSRVLLFAAGKKLKKACGERKENELFVD